MDVKLMRFSCSFLALFLVTAFPPSLRAEQPVDAPLRVIDVHTHPEFAREVSGVDDSSRETFLREWEESGLVGAVGILHTQNGETPDLGDRPMVYCAGLVDDPDIPTLDKGLSDGTYGCIKIYLGYVHRWAYDPIYEPVYRLAEKHDVPVVFHTGDTWSPKAKLKYADPLTVDEVAVDHPNVRFVIAHCGYPWIDSAAEVTYKNPNVYIECSAMLVGDMNEMEEGVVDEWMVRNVRWVFGYIEDPSKMMFGSDWPLVKIGPYVEAYKRAIPKEHWNAVFHDNAARVFGFEEEAGTGTRDARIPRDESVTLLPPDPSREPLDPAAFDSISKASSLHDIASALGAPHKQAGSGIYILVWHSSDGRRFIVGTSSLAPNSKPLYARFEGRRHE